MADYEVFELGDVELQSGVSFTGAKLAYKTFGTLNRRKDNVVVFPTFYGGTHIENEPLIGEGLALEGDEGDGDEDQHHERRAHHGSEEL